MFLDVNCFLPTGIGVSVNSYFTFLVFGKLLSICNFVFVFVFLFLIFSMFCTSWVFNIKSSIELTFKLFNCVFFFDLFSYFSLCFPIFCSLLIIFFTSRIMSFEFSFNGINLLVHVTSFQWGWSFSISFYDFLGCTDLVSFNSGSDVENSLIRDSPFPLILPVDCNVLFLTCSKDVIHSFCIDSLGIKMDCVPGRLNSIVSSSMIEGVFFGNCSEFCGESHAFMGFRVEFVSFSDFIKVLTSLI